MTYRDDVPDGAFHEKITRTIPGTAIVLTFEWHGGTYIDVARIGRTPREVINVWNVAADQPRIPRTSEAFNARVDEWIEDYGAESLASDVAHWSD